MFALFSTAAFRRCAYTSKWPFSDYLPIYSCYSVINDYSKTFIFFDWITGPFLSFLFEVELIKVTFEPVFKVLRLLLVVWYYEPLRVKLSISSGFMFTPPASSRLWLNFNIDKLVVLLYKSLSLYLVSYVKYVWSAYYCWF